MEQNPVPVRVMPWLVLMASLILAQSVRLVMVT